MVDGGREGAFASGLVLAERGGTVIGSECAEGAYGLQEDSLKYPEAHGFQESLPPQRSLGQQTSPVCFQTPTPLVHISCSVHAQLQNFFPSLASSIFFFLP